MKKVVEKVVEKAVEKKVVKPVVKPVAKPRVKRAVGKKILKVIVDEQFAKLSEKCLHGSTEDMEIQQKQINRIKEDIKKNI